MSHLFTVNKQIIKEDTVIFDWRTRNPLFCTHPCKLPGIYYSIYMASTTVKALSPPMCPQKRKPIGLLLLLLLLFYPQGLWGHLIWLVLEIVASLHLFTHACPTSKHLSFYCYGINKQLEECACQHTHSCTLVFITTVQYKHTTEAI